MELDEDEDGNVIDWLYEGPKPLQHSKYMNGPSGALPLADGPEEILTGASTQQSLIISFQKVRDDLVRRQTDHANKLSTATAARVRAFVTGQRRPLPSRLSRIHLGSSILRGCSRICLAWSLASSDR